MCQGVCTIFVCGYDAHAHLHACVLILRAHASIPTYLHAYTKTNEGSLRVSSFQVRRVSDGSIKHHSGAADRDDEGMRGVCMYACVCECVCLCVFGACLLCIDVYI